ncbi:hypothetical protein L208DRAFT_1404966 [Tricholoma matsutake]|nr:hypothetical protein L208DRAFT_1404966 [Tricholoma matsutake 945]
MAQRHLKRRQDGRSHHKLRIISVKFPGLARVDGSASFSFGGSISTGITPYTTPTSTATSAIASLTGPAEVRLASEHPSQLTFDVLLRPFCGVPATESKALAANVRNVLGTSLIWSANPRSLVQMVIQTLGSGWGTQDKRAAGDVVMATAVNAGMLALMNAGSVPLKGVVCAVAVGRLADDDVLVVDPGEDETGDLSASGCFAFLFSCVRHEGVVGRCVWTNWRAVGKGRFDEPVLEEGKELARRAAEEVYVAMKKSIESVEEHSEFEEPTLRKGKGKGKGKVMAHVADAEIQPDNDDSADGDDNKMEI